MKVTVCIPTVRPTSLSAAVAAVRRQDWPDWELVVVGQGAAERELRRAVASAACTDERIRYQHLDRLGISAARNAGVEAALGDKVLKMTESEIRVMVHRKLALVEKIRAANKDGPLTEEAEDQLEVAHGELLMLRVMEDIAEERRAA